MPPRPVPMGLSIALCTIAFLLFHLSAQVLSKTETCAIVLGSWVCILTVHICCKTCFRRRYSPFSDLPGPQSKTWLWDHGFDIFGEPLGERIASWINERPYPDGFMHFFGFFGTSFLVPTNPRSLSECQTTISYDLHKTRAFSSYARRFFGHGLVTQEEDEHKVNRKTYHPVFNPRAITKLHDTLTAKSLQLVHYIRQKCDQAADAPDNQSPDGEARTVILPISQPAAMVTLDIVGLISMGVDFNTLANKNREVYEAFEVLFSSSLHKYRLFIMHNLLPRWIMRFVPSTTERRMDQAHASLVSIIRKTIQERDRTMAESWGHDYLSNALRMGSLSPEEVTPQIITIMSAGYETTGGTLAWTIYCLASHPESQSALREELKHADAPINGNKDVYDTLPFLNAVVMESSRLYPSFPFLPHKAVRDTTLDNRHVPAGTYVGIAPLAINYAKHIWGPDADCFNPERWLGRSDPAGVRQNPLGGAPASVCMMSFGYVTRSCVGKALAIAQIKRQVALLVKGFRIDRISQENPRPVGLFASGPPPEMRVRFTDISRTIS